MGRVGSMAHAAGAGWRPTRSQEHLQCAAPPASPATGPRASRPAGRQPSRAYPLRGLNPCPLPARNGHPINREGNHPRVRPGTPPPAPTPAAASASRPRSTAIQRTSGAPGGPNLRTGPQHGTAGRPSAQSSRPESYVLTPGSTSLARRVATCPMSPASTSRSAGPPGSDSTQLCAGAEMWPVVTSMAAVVPSATAAP